jgi:mRNA interferase MazF
MRGEVWDVAIPRVGPHPAVVLTINELRGHYDETTVALVTGTSGPRLTHVPVGADSGLTKYDESYVNVTNLFSIPTSKFRLRRGLLHRHEMNAVESGIRLTLGLGAAD